jgi:uncharacterized protein
MNIKEFAQNLQALYDEMSDVFSHYQSQTGLKCLSGCGQCCNNPEVEASYLEMLPLALKIYEENKLEEWLEELTNNSSASCLMYQPHSEDRKLGQCGAYKERPSLCRMFGVSGYQDKYQKVILSICKHIKAENPELAQSVESQASSENTPLMIQWSYRLVQLDPALVQQRVPINQALLRALEKVALYAHLMNLNSKSHQT